MLDYIKMKELNLYNRALSMLFVFAGRRIFNGTAATYTLDSNTAYCSVTCVSFLSPLEIGCIEWVTTFEL